MHSCLNVQKAMYKRERKSGRQELDVYQILTEKGQKAFDDELNTWIKYGVVTVIPPQIAKNVPNEYIIDSRAIWTKRSDIKM